MPFTFKLSQRLARMWPSLLAFLLPQLPQFLDSHHLLEGTCLALLVALRRAVAIKALCLESGDCRRRRHIALPNGRRMRDRHPCRDFCVPGTRWTLRVAFLPVHKIP